MIACKDENIRTIQPKLILSKSELNDSIFFADVTTIQYYNNELYFGDHASVRILVTDADLNFKRTFVHKGDAEFESKSVYRFSIHNDTLYVADQIHAKVIKFHVSGKFGSSFRHPALGFGAFSVYDKLIYSFVDKDDYQTRPILVSNALNGQSVRSFGNIENGTFNNPDRHVMYHEGLLYVVNNENYPRIEMYDIHGKHLSTWNLDEIHPLKKLFANSVLLFKEKLKYQQNTTFEIFPSCSIVENKLFLSLTNINERQVAESNKILVFDITNQNLSFEYLIELDVRDWYEAFQFLPDKNILCAYDSKHESIKFYDASQILTRQTK